MSHSPAITEGVLLDPLKDGDGLQERSARIRDGKDRRSEGRAMVGEPLPLLLRAAELRDRLGLGVTKFWSLRKAGAFDGLAASIPGFYSGPKVLAWLEREPASRVNRRSHT